MLSPSQFLGKKGPTAGPVKMVFTLQLAALMADGVSALVCINHTDGRRNIGGTRINIQYIDSMRSFDLIYTEKG